MAGANIDSTGDGAPLWGAKDLRTSALSIGLLKTTAKVKNTGTIHAGKHAQEIELIQTYLP